MLDFLRDVGGNIAVISGILLTPIVAGAGIAYDYTRADWVRSDLLEAAESAAVASASSIDLMTQDPIDNETRKSVAVDFFSTNFGRQSSVGNVKVSVKLEPLKSTVTASARVPTSLMRITGKEYVFTEVVAAAVVDETPACLLITAESQNDALLLQGSAGITTRNCIVQVNSSSSSAARAQGNPSMSQAEFCLSGGHSGRRWDASVTTTGCERLEDEYDSIALPSPGPCDETRFRSNNRGVNAIKPGVYCEGMRFTPNSRTTMEPGIYHVVDGTLDIEANSEISGDGVVFVLHGEESNFEIHSGASLDLVGMRSGPLKGFLIYQDPAIEPDNSNEITAGGEIDLVGIIYSPNAELELRGSPEINLEAGGNALVVQTLKLQGNPELNISNTRDPDLTPNLQSASVLTNIRVVQ